MAGKTALHRLAQIFERMPFVGDLESLWNSWFGSGCIHITAVSTDDFNGRVAFGLGGHRSHLPIRQHLESVMAFQKLVVVTRAGVCVCCALGPCDQNPAQVYMSS